MLCVAEGCTFYVIIVATETHVVGKCLILCHMTEVCGS